MNRKHNILCDLSLGHISFGWSGIPQDTRFLFDSLNSSDKLNMTGHLYGANQDPFHLDIGKINNSDEERVSAFLGGYLNGMEIVQEPSFARRIISTLFPFSSHIYRAYDRLSLNGKTDFELLDIPEAFYASIWRQYFSLSIPVEHQERLFHANYKYSGLSIARMNHAALGRFKQPVLNTNGFDFAIFQDSRYVRLSNGTIPVARYHDGLPIFSPDIVTVINMEYAIRHSHSIRLSENVVYVCNSPNSLNDLTLINEKAAGSAHVIPYFLPVMKKPEVRSEILKDIFELRKSPSTQPGSNETGVDIWFNKQKEIPKFVMTLSTIEPRKNITGLINAWQMLRYRSGEDIKLLVAGKPAWGFEPTLNAMRPHIKKGDLMHIEGVAQHELPYLYAAASCFVFPSFAEGFGLPPNEAMQCDCPVAVSDIEAHRYSCGDAALYFNPYDLDGMAATMETLVNADKNSDFIQDLIAKGHGNVDRYSHANVLPQWEDLFDKLKAEKK